MKFYTKFNPPPSEASKIDPLSMTCQEFKDECDINQIVTKPNYGINPLKPPTSQPIFGDFTDVRLQDFQTAQNLLVESNEAFMSLDSRLRARFDNEPGKLLEFLADDKNRDEAIYLGLIEKPEVVSTPVVEQSPTKSAETPSE